MARRGMRIEGTEQVLQNMNAKINEIRGVTIGGLLAGGLVVQREAQKRVPVDTGNLRASAYTRRAMEPGEKAVEVGFEAAYAVFVHENMEQKLKGERRPSGRGVFWGPRGRPKFLESALYDKMDEVLAAIRRRIEL